MTFALKAALKIESILRWDCVGSTSKMTENIQIIASARAIVFIL
jgi:hypothetical protein